MSTPDKIKQLAISEGLVTLKEAAMDKLLKRPYNC